LAPVSADGGIPQPTARQSETFYKQLAVDNTAAAKLATLKITGVKNLIGPAGEDAVTEITKTAEPRGSGRCLLVFGRQRRQRSKRHRPRQPLLNSPGNLRAACWRRVGVRAAAETAGLGSVITLAREGLIRGDR
jgi:hypothetical protein